MWLRRAQHCCARQNKHPLVGMTFACLSLKLDKQREQPMQKQLERAADGHLWAMALCMRVPAFSTMWKKRKLRNRLMSSTLPLRMPYVYSHLR
jgi:hypothetical protein